MSSREIEEWLAQHPTWRREKNQLVREVESSNYARLVQLIQAQVEIVERLDHHPALTLTYGQLRVAIWTHDLSGVTQLDFDYARSFDEMVQVHFPDGIAD